MLRIFGDCVRWYEVVTHLFRTPLLSYGQNKKNSTNNIQNYFNLPPSCKINLDRPKHYKPGTGTNFLLEFVIFNLSKLVSLDYCKINTF